LVLQQIDTEFKHELLESLDQLAQISKERAQTGRSDSEDVALREIRHQMRELATEAFYLQIKTFTLERLVMMLDACEWLSEPEGIEVGQWILNELIPEMHTRIRQKDRRCSVIMFSRVQPRLDVIKGQDQRRLTLPMLGKAEVYQYLEHMGMHDSDLRQRVYEVTHGHALCVSIIGDFWQQREAQKEPFTIADLPELQVQEFSEIALMRFTNERVLRQLKPPFKELTQYGVLLRSFDLPLLRTVFPELLPEPEALERFNQLIHYPYIESRGNYRYAFLELLREALAEVTQRERPEEWKGCHKRALDYLTEVSPHSPDWYYHLLAYDEKQGLEAWQQAIQEARESGKREYSSALLQAALDKALKLSPAAHAEIAYEQGRFNYSGVQWEEALKSYKEALASFKEVEDLPRHANCYQAIGDVQRALGKLNDALESYEKARMFYQQLGDQFGEANCCQAMGDVQRLHNDLDAALQCYEQCLDLFRQVNDKLEEAKALEAVGDVQRMRNEQDAALKSYEQALALYQEEKDRLKRAKVLKAIGDVQRLRQERNAALESYGQALALFGELKESAEEADVRRAIGEMEQLQDRQKALEAISGNVYQTHVISVLEARNGTNRVLILPNGKQVMLPIPPGAYNGQVIRLEGYGKPTIYNGTLGALILTIVVAEVDGGVSPVDVSVRQKFPTPIMQSEISPTLPAVSSRRGQVRGSAILKMCLALVLLLGMASLFYFSVSRAISPLKGNTTATAVYATQAAATTTEVACPSYLPGCGTLALYDPLRDDSKGYDWHPPDYSGCDFLGGALHVSVNGDEANPVFFHACIGKTPTFSDFTYEIKMTFIKGDCGGVIFRSHDPMLYYFYICQDGEYGIVRNTRDPDNGMPDPNLNPPLRTSATRSSSIIAGSSQANIIAVQARGSIIDLYVNQHLIDSVEDNSYRDGTIGVLAKALDLYRPTEAAFSDARVWTF